jgi:hypothetical protein
MPIVPFESLPASARVWVFATEQPVQGARAERFLGAVDHYLGQWTAHGHPLTCGRAWRDDQFLAVAVDQTDAYASGCSIDGLFRVLQTLQSELGATLVSGGRVVYRDPRGVVKTVSRDEFSVLGSSGAITGATTVFDPTVATAGEWRDRFETAAGKTWHKALLA